MTLTLNRTTLLADAALLGAACLVPAASHLFALPFYQLDPMRWLLAAALLVGAHGRMRNFNGYLMAVAIPLVSCAVVGMPSPVKALLIAAELCVNVFVLSFLLDKMQGLGRNTRVVAAVLGSVVCAKLAYYLLKTACVSLGLLGGSVIGTPVMVQLLAVAVPVLVFTVACRLTEAGR